MSVNIVWFPDYGHIVAGIFFYSNKHCAQVSSILYDILVLGNSSSKSLFSENFLEIFDTLDLSSKSNWFIYSYNMIVNFPFQSAKL